jgi:hypothetical protein
VEADPELSPHDLRERERAARAGRDISVSVGVTHFFSLADAPGDRPKGAEDALRVAGIDDLFVDEELSGDRYWHIAAFTVLLLEPRAIRSAERQMAQLATDNGCVYDGWHVTLTAGEGPPNEPQVSEGGTP